MGVTIDAIREAIRGFNLAGRPLCIHSSLRSFGAVEGGAASILGGLAAEDCTVLVPAFSDAFLIPPPPELRPARNGWDYRSDAAWARGAGLIYTPDSDVIDRDMGALAAAVVSSPGRCRGDHALNSFAAVGPLARRLIATQRPLDVFGPLKVLAESEGFVVLMGVGPERMTLIHLAEALAGRRPFRRWANNPDGRPMTFETGGCSEGFGNLEPILSPHAATARVGESRWTVFPARRTLEALAGAIRSRPEVTQCGGSSCLRCHDGVQGGPIIREGQG